MKGKIRLPDIRLIRKVLPESWWRDQVLVPTPAGLPRDHQTYHIQFPVDHNATTNKGAKKK